MEKTKYSKYISKEIIQESKYPQITAPMVKYRGDRGGRGLTFEWYCVTKPFVMDDEPEVNEFDQIMYFIGSNLDDLSEFQAEVELPLGKEGKKQIINESKMVHIPSGLVHGPLNFKNIKKPIVYYSFYLAPDYSTKWDKSTDYGKFLAKLTPSTGRQKMEITGPDGHLFRYQYTDSYSIMGFCEPHGLSGKLSWGYNVVKRPRIEWEPFHYHNYLDEWIIFMGGNPLDVEDFDAETEMCWGEEHERHILDSTCVCHIPPKQIHYSNDHRRVGKPFIEIIATAPTGNYFKEKDRIVVAKEEDGDVMEPADIMDREHAV